MPKPDLRVRVLAMLAEFSRSPRARDRYATVARLVAALNLGGGPGRAVTPAQVTAALLWLEKAGRVRRRAPGPDPEAPRLWEVV